MNNVEVKNINHGIACRIGNKIYVNSNLQAFPELYRAILSHEKKHSSGFVWNDMVIDVVNNELRNLKKEYYRFIITHPSSWTEFLPFWFYERRFVFNPLITFIYFFALVLGRFIWIRIV